MFIESFNFCLDRIYVLIHFFMNEKVETLARNNIQPIVGGIIILSDYASLITFSTKNIDFKSIYFIHLSISLKFKVETLTSRQ